MFHNSWFDVEKNKAEFNIRDSAASAGMIVEVECHTDGEYNWCTSQWLITKEQGKELLKKLQEYLSEH